MNETPNNFYLFNFYYELTIEIWFVFIVMVVFRVMMITVTIIESLIHGPQSLLLSFLSGYSEHNHNNKNDSNFTCYNLFCYLQLHKNKCLTQSTIIKRNLSMIKTKTKMTNYHQKKTKQNKTKIIKINTWY